MIEKYTTIYTVLDKIRTDIGVEAEYRWSDIKSWIADTMQKINTQAILQRANTQVIVTDHRAKIPCNVIRTIAVTYNKQRLRYGGEVRNITSNRRFPIRNVNGSTLGQESDFIESYWINQFYINKNNQYDEDGNLIQSTVVDNTTYLKNVASTSLVSEYYEIDVDWYKFSFPTGIVEIDYIGVYTDDEGFPMIPDSAHLREALFLWVLYKMVGSGFQHPIYQGIQGVQMLKQMYEEELLRAKSAINMPSWDSFRGFVADYVKLIPDFNRDDYYRQNTESRINERTSTRQGFLSIWGRGI